MRSVIAGLLFSLHAFAALAQPTYMLKQAEPDTGSHIRKPVATTLL